MDALEPSLFAQIDEKGFVPDDVRNGFFRKLRMKSDNRSCFECTARNPTWISLTYGVYLCLECSGEHRRKGVHISFVRSVELDRFSPEQMVQMACGGNGKAWEFFKQSGMGKTSDAGRAIDYNSKIAQRYKQQVERDAALSCEKLGVAVKVLAAKVAAADPVDEAADFAGTPQAQAAAPEPTAVPKAAAPVPAKAAAVAAPPPSTVKVIRVPVVDTAASSPSIQKVTSPTAAPTSSTAVPKAAGFAGKQQKAKEIDFDFDFDELETEAAKPPPVVAPAKVATPVAAMSPSAFKPAVAAAKPEAPRTSTEAAAKFEGRKAISSDDFFNEAESETASARVERESRYQKFAGAGAISSSSFFGNPDASEERPRDELDDWKAGLSRGAELITTYLNKVRD